MDANGHLWRAIVPFDLTPDDALRMVEPEPGDPGEVIQRAGDDPPPPGDPRPFLGTHNIVRKEVVVACMICEQACSREAAEKQCPGEPSGYDAQGVPVWDERQPLRPPPSITNVPGGLGTVGRNEPCPCGSGLKWKKCHGA